MKSFTILIVFGLFPVFQMQNCPDIQNIKGMEKFNINGITSSVDVPSRWYVVKYLGTQNLPTFHEDLKAATFYFRSESSNYKVEQRQRNREYRCIKTEGTLYFKEPDTFEQNAKVTINYTSTNLPPFTNPWTVEHTYWFLGTDYKQYLIMYSCSSVTSTTVFTCERHNVFVFSHDKSIHPGLVIEEINNILRPYCIPEYNYLKSTDWSGYTECLPEDESNQFYTKSSSHLDIHKQHTNLLTDLATSKLNKKNTEKCDMDFLEYETSVDFNNFKDKHWYAVRQMGYHQDILPKDSTGAIVRFEMNNGHVRLIFYGVDGKNNCIGPKEGTIQMRNDNNGRFDVQFGFRKFLLLILREPSQELPILYFCEVKANNGSCAAGKQIFVLSRDKAFNGLLSFTQFLTHNCIDSLELNENNFYKDKNCYNGASIGYYLSRWMWLQLILAILLL